MDEPNWDAERRDFYEWIKQFPTRSCHTEVVAWKAWIRGYERGWNDAINRVAKNVPILPDEARSVAEGVDRG